jgi:general stress protein 26
MTARIDPDTHEFRFLTRLSTHKIDELAAEPDVNLAFCDPQAGDYVSVSGQAYLTQDRSLVEQLWNGEAEALLACRRDDPDLAVIRVVPAEAEFWEGSGRLRQTWNLFKAKHDGRPGAPRRGDLA